MALYRSNHSHTALSKQRNATELPPRGNQALGLYRRPSQLALYWPATRILAALYRSGHTLWGLIVTLGSRADRHSNENSWCFIVATTIAVKPLWFNSGGSSSLIVEVGFVSQSIAAFGFQFTAQCFRSESALIGQNKSRERNLLDVGKSEVGDLH